MDNKENIDPISEGTHTTIVLLHSDIENDDFFFSDDSVTLETPETTTNEHDNPRHDEEPTVTTEMVAPTDTAHETTSSIPEAAAVDSPATENPSMSSPRRWATAFCRGFYDSRRFLETDSDDAEVLSFTTTDECPSSPTTLNASDTSNHDRSSDTSTLEWIFRHCSSLGDSSEEQEEENANDEVPPVVCNNAGSTPPPGASNDLPAPRTQNPYLTPPPMESLAENPHSLRACALLAAPKKKNRNA